MLPCIPRSKQSTDDLNHRPESSHKGHLSKSLSSQFKEMALRASGAYRQCNTCTASITPHTKHKHHCTNESGSNSTSISASDSFKRMYRRTTSSSNSMPFKTGLEIEAGNARDRAVVFVEEMEPREWIAQVEPGVLITFVSLVGGGNHLKSIRFSKEIFDKTRAQRWWTENFDRVMELYNVQRLDRQAFPLHPPAKSEDEIGKGESGQETPATPQLNKEHPPSTFRSIGTRYSSSDSLDHQSQQFRDSNGLTATPKQSTISTTKTEVSDASKTTSSTRDDSLSISNASDVDSEWVEEDEPGVYITIKAYSNGTKELKRVRFSREKFGEIHARVWWEENRKRVHEKYL